MKIPNTLKIGGHTVKITCHQEIDGLSGRSIVAKNEIQICKTLPQSQKEGTLIHEIFHFINTTLDGDRMGHALLDSLSEQFYQVLSDNKLLK